MTEYPRVLVAGEAFNSNRGGGITLSNLFHNWPSNRLANVHDIPSRNTNICQHHYVYKSRSPLARLAKRYPVTPEDAITSSEAIHLQTPSNCFPYNNYKYLFKQYFTNHIYPFWLFHQPSISLDLKSWIDQFCPELVYLQPSASNLSMVAQIANYVSCPYVIHFMDDWPSYQSSISRVFRLHVEKRISILLRNIISNASYRMAISSMMANEYSTRYLFPFYPFQNPVDSMFWAIEDISDIACSCTENCKVLYPGRLNTHNALTLHLLLEAIEMLNSNGGRYQLSITDTKSSLSAKYGLDESLIGHISYNKMPYELSCYDVLVLPFGFSKESIAYQRLSMPTKVPEFLASGIPTIVIAPASTALSKYATTENWAKVVNTLGIQDIGNMLKTMSDKHERESMSIRGRALAIKYHDSNDVKTKFQNILINTARK